MNTNAPVPVHALTAKNLRASPVWAYLLDAEGDEEIDESYVIPVAAPPPIGSYGSYLLSATYTLPGGEELPGAVQLDQLGTKRQFTPMLIHVAGKSLDPLAVDVSRQLSRLRKTPSGPPIRWTLAITLPDDNAPASGRIARSRWFQALALLAQLVSLFFTRRSR